MMDGNNGNGNGGGDGNPLGPGHGHAQAQAQQAQAQQPHSYIQENPVYDDVMNNSVWPPPAPGPGDQFLYTHPQQAHQPQEFYARYAAAQPQPSFEHYGLSQQPSYPSLDYSHSNSNSPYVSHYQQHVPPSHVFGQSSSSVDPSLQTSAPSPYRSQDSSFSVPPNATISPQYLQYAVPPSQPVNRGLQSSAFQPPSTNGIANAFIQSPQDHSAMYFNSVNEDNLNRSTGTPIQYAALSPEKQVVEPTPASNHADKINGIKNHAKSESSQIPPRAQPSRPTKVSDPLRMTHTDLYASKAGQGLAYAPFIVFEDSPIQITLGLKNTIPKYHPRRSRSGKDVIPGFTSSRSSTPARGTIKKMRAPKKAKTSLSKPKEVTPEFKPIAGKVAPLPGESIQGAESKSPPTPTESSSEEETSSEEESEYEDEEDMQFVDVSTIRGSTRPVNDVAAAARWDAIGIVWRDPASSPSIEVVQAAIEEYGNFLIERRNKLKANSKEADGAAGRPADVSRLATERGILLEALYQTVDAANTHGYGAIVENLGRYHKLVNGLTTTLIDCLKMDDYLGKLPRAVFSLLARFQTMTDDLLKKLKFDSIQKRWRKQEDPEINLNIELILTNTVDAKERAAKLKKETDKAEEGKKVLEKSEKAKLRVADTNKAAAVNPAKRPHEGDGTNGKPSKKLATDTSNTTIKAPPKRNNLLGISSKVASKPVVKKRDISPPGESKLGALLASIAKPPEPPKPPEAPPRPPETPDEKIRRERKESRRHLRVKFKEGTELEEVRLFKHEQAEDEGRQDDMLRDAHDYRSEGIMHKRRVSEAREEEDEIQSGEIEARQYPELVGVDLTGLEKSTPIGHQYTTRGGDMAFTTPEQEAQMKREALELMAIYVNPNDIPPSPKEPPHQRDEFGKERPELLLREPTAPWLVQRLQEIRQHGSDYATQISIRRIEEQQGRRFGEHLALGDLHSLAPHNGSSSRVPYQQTQNQNIANKVQIPGPKMEPHEYLNLLRIIDPIKGKPYPPVEPPDWMTNETQRMGWWEGYNRDKAIKDRMEAEQNAQQEGSQYQPPPVQYTPQMSMPQAQSYQQPQQQPSTNIPSAPAQPDLAQQVQTLLAGYGNGNSAATQQFDYSAWAASATAQAQAYANQAQQPKWDANWNENSNTNKAQDHSTAGSKKRGTEKREWQESLFDENGEYKGKKKPCRFWREGKCQKGAKCTYLHD